MTFACTATRAYYEGPHEQLPTFTIEAASRDEAHQKAGAITGPYVSFHLEEI